MRLICPSCGAQYQVAEDVIPPAGRDVQCSSCAHTWFETPGASEAREAAEGGAAPEATVAAPESASPPPSEAPTAQPAAPRDTKTRIIGMPEEPAAAPQVASRDLKTRIIETAVETTHTAEEPIRSRDVKTRIIEPSNTDVPDALAPPTEPDVPDTPSIETPAVETSPVADDTPVPTVDADNDQTRQPLPSAVADILREEAAREETLRQADAAAPVETQPDLGLDRPLDRDQQLAEEARRRMARLKGEASPAIGAATAAGGRSDLLPDIEEINSTLKSETPKAEKVTKDKTAKPKSGFRRGFMTVVLLALLALLIYILAPRIGAMVPAIEQPLAQYVEFVDKIRLWLDLRLQGLLSSDDAG